MTKTSRWISLVLILVLNYGYVLTAQQDAHFSQYMFNSLNFNPAYSGILNTEFVLIHRSQWLGYNPTNNSGGAPSSQYLGMTTPLKVLHGGVGLTLLNDKLGGIRNSYAKLNYSYQLKLNQDSKISIGLSGGVYSLSSSSNYIYNDLNDPNINTIGFQQSKPDLALGILYFHTNYYFGISANHLNSAKFDINNNSYTALAKHYYFTAGYTVEINDQLKLKPSAVLKMDKYPQNLSFDLNSNLEFRGKYWVGCSYRKQEAVVGLAGMSFLKNNSLKLGYAFDYVTNGRGAKALTSHELMLSYVIPPSLSINKPIIRTPRYRYN